MSFRVLESGYNKVTFQLMHENHFRTLNIPGTIAHAEARIYPHWPWVLSKFRIQAPPNDGQLG